jgi:hypothetical protein
MTFDEQVAALRGKVGPKKFRGRKSDATPEQWAAHAECRRQYNQRPDIKAAEAERMRLYNQQPEVKLARAEYRRRWLSKPESKLARAEWRRRHRQRPHVKAAEAESKHRRRQRPDVKVAEAEWKRLYRQRPTVRAAVAEMKRSRFLEDFQFRMAESLRSRLGKAVRGGRKSGSAVRDLGCSIADLKAHLERQFQTGMSWENWGAGHGKWQIDHIFPLAKTDLTDRVQLLAVCNWQNLQPLWFEDNVRKGDTVTPEAQQLFDGLVSSFQGGVR